MPQRLSRRVRVAHDAPRLRRPGRHRDPHLRVAGEGLRREPRRPLARAGGTGRLGGRLRGVHRRAPRHRPRLRHLHDRATRGRRVGAARVSRAREPVLGRRNEHLAGRGARLPRCGAGAVAGRTEGLPQHPRRQRPRPRHRPDPRPRTARLHLWRLVRHIGRDPVLAAAPERRDGRHPRLGGPAWHRVLLGLRRAVRSGAPLARRPLRRRPGVRGALGRRSVDRPVARDGADRVGRVPRRQADPGGPELLGAVADPARRPARRRPCAPASHRSLRAAGPRRHPGVPGRRRRAPGRQPVSAPVPGTLLERGHVGPVGVARAQHRRGAVALRRVLDLWRGHPLERQGPGDVAVVRAGPPRRAPTGHDGQRGAAPQRGPRSADAPAPRPGLRRRVPPPRPTRRSSPCGTAPTTR